MLLHPSALELAWLALALATVPSSKAARAASGSALLPLPEADVKLLWFSPIVLQPLPEPPAFAQALARAAVDLFEAFQADAFAGDVSSSFAAAALKLTVCGGDDNACFTTDSRAQWLGRVETEHLNDAFFKFQRRRGAEGGVWDTATGALGSLPEVARLRRYLHEAAAKTRASVGMPEEEEEKGPASGRGADDLYCWCSVHEGRSLHPIHTHPNNELSAVFFAAVPPGAGTPTVCSMPPRRW
jgi:hypothetical protein